MSHELEPAIHGDEIALWFHGDSVDYGSNISYGISTANVGTDFRLLNEPTEERVMNGNRVEVPKSILTKRSNCESNLVENVTILSHDLNNAGIDYGSNISYGISTANVGTDLRLLNEPTEERVMNGIRVEVPKSILTKRSNCESNLVENVAILSHDLNNAGNPGSSGSEFSFGRTDQRNISNQSHKRKMRNEEEPEHHIADTDESIDAYKSARLSSSAAGRSRTAEVHNLSEKRRRDRINEKMRALQELIPNCSKLDKAKLLDDAIEYLKSLQLQLQDFRS